MHVVKWCTFLTLCRGHTTFNQQLLNQRCLCEALKNILDCIQSEIQRTLMMIITLLILGVFSMCPLADSFIPLPRIHIRIPRLAPLVRHVCRQVLSRVPGIGLLHVPQEAVCLAALCPRRYLPGLGHVVADVKAELKRRLLPMLPPGAHRLICSLM